MKLFKCDMCGKLIHQCIKITVDTETMDNFYRTWSAGKTAGDYCQECANKISIFVESERRKAGFES